MRRHPSMNVVRDDWSPLDAFFASLIAGVIVLGIVGATMLIIMLHPH